MITEIPSDPIEQLRLLSYGEIIITVDPNTLQPFLHIPSTDIYTAESDELSAIRQQVYSYSKYKRTIII